MATSAPFSRAAVRAMKKLYPQALADSSWDNTGLLLESPLPPHTENQPSNTILLTIDLTKAVADEAIALRSSIVIAYHPIIFRGLKAITLANSQQHSLLRLASHGISVYSPHTAVDAAPGGLGDWLADIVTGTKRQNAQPDLQGNEEVVESVEQSPPTTKKPTKAGKVEENDDPFIDRQRPPAFTLNHHPSRSNMRTAATAPVQEAVPHTRRAVIPQSPALESHPGAGMGRIVTFEQSQPLSTLLDRIGRGLNNPKGFPIAIPQNMQMTDLSIKTIGICAGSGASLLSNLDVDLLFTGEMSHHEALAAIEKGQVVVSLFHSNSERGFLEEVLRGQLEEEVVQTWREVRMEEEEAGLKGLEEDFEVLVSEVDRDPFGIVILKE